MAASTPPSRTPPTGIIWKIDRFATHDGPGIRTALYFKGCRLKCAWCSNPEGQSFRPFLVFEKSRCIGCGVCSAECPVRAIQAAGGDAHDIRITRSKCDLCGKCAALCPTTALRLWGRPYGTDAIIEILQKDRWIHQRSGGGLTCTGGEPVCQWPFLRGLLERCGQLGIHRAVETCALANERDFAEMLELVDWLFVDIKHLDPAAHLRLTGRDNALVLGNIRMASAVLRERDKPLVIRTVLVPGLNDAGNVAALADFLACLPWLSGVELLPYHAYGASKYQLLGRRYRLAGLEPPPDTAVEAAKRVFSSRSLELI